MREDQNQVDSSESILRRIHAKFFDGALEIPIQAEAFRPTERDEDGISVFRERFVNAGAILANVPPEKQPLYYVARIAVCDLEPLNLTVMPAPLDELPGHAIIPELNWASYQRDKTKLKFLQLKLAILASKSIVHKPSVER